MKSITEIVPFDTRIYTTTLSDYRYLISHIKDIKTVNPTVIKSNKGGWQSESYSNDSLSFMAPLLNEIVPLVKEIYTQLSIDGNCTDINYWFNINNRYDYNCSHRHGNSYFSAVVYLKVPTNSGNIVFERPDDMRDFIQFKEDTENNWGSYWIEPKENALILFPSYVPHYVEQNRTENIDDERISIAFNFK
jgi:uncharacterized protein (TIGR02466 family)